MRTYKEKGIFRFLRDLMVIWLLVLIVVGVSLLFSFLSERDRERERERGHRRRGHGGRGRRRAFCDSGRDLGEVSGACVLVSL